MNNSSEKINRSPETEAPSVEALDRAAFEHRERIRENLEHEATNADQEQVEDLRAKAVEHAANTLPDSNEDRAARLERPSPRGPISKSQRDASFAATMREVRGQMPAPSRAFSKVIHVKVVEKASDATAKTIARPNAIVSGAIAAFVVTLLVYLLARNYGYPLSGFESIGAFVAGWVIGLTFDFIKVMVTGRK